MHGHKNIKICWILFRQINHFYREINYSKETRKYMAADKSLARPGRKPANVSVRIA